MAQRKGILQKTIRRLSEVRSDEIRLLAIIAAGTKRTAKSRRVNILEVAKALRDLLGLRGSRDDVSNAVKLSPEMVRQFVKLLSLTDKVKTLINAGLINSVDIGYRISKLSEKDQIVLAEEVLRKKLTSEDVRDIVKYRIDNPSLSITRAIKTVVDSKVRKVFVAYLGVNKKTYERIHQECRKWNLPVLIESLFEKVVGKRNIVFFRINGTVILIKVSEEGLMRMKSKAKRSKTSLPNLANVLVVEYLEKYE
jgi:hypothetical protein